ncbi:MAG: hypothetical protein HOE62_10870 [Alphaproteobacteria bacterium]|jgi:hypothetical protein|nr:hypothetical protein [Alphaproteobacteria bacterium]MBT4018440.1 hypothetical protein [Alphaproteobacteria bacterium]
MFIFKNPEDLSQLPPGNRARFLLENILERLISIHAKPPVHDPELHGYAVLIEALDVYREAILPELPCPLADVPWEGVTLEGGFYHAVVLTNNTFAIDFVIPDADWLPETLRTSLKENLSHE